MIVYHYANLPVGLHVLFAADDGSSLRSEATSAGESLISVKEAALEDQADNTSVGVGVHLYDYCF